MIVDPINCLISFEEQPRYVGSDFLVSCQSIKHITELDRINELL